MGQHRFTDEDLHKMNLHLNPDGTYSKKKSEVKPAARKTKQTHVEMIQEVYDVRSGDMIFSWSGKSISLNEWYSSKHWTVRNKVAKEWHKFFADFDHKKQVFDKYLISLRFNSRLDPSNCITMIKLCEDHLQKAGFIKNDNKDVCRGINIQPDERLKKNSYVISISATL